MEIKQENFQIKQVIRQTYQESQIDFNIYSNPNLKETCSEIQQLDQNSILLEIKNQIIDNDFHFTNVENIEYKIQLMHRFQNIFYENLQSLLSQINDNQAQEKLELIEIDLLKNLIVYFNLNIHFNAVNQFTDGYQFSCKNFFKKQDILVDISPILSHKSINLYTKLYLTQMFYTFNKIQVKDRKYQKIEKNLEKLHQNFVLSILKQNLFEETFDHQQINEVLEKIKQEKLFLQQSEQTDSLHTFLGLTILIIINRSKILRKYPQFPLIMINFFLQSLKEPESYLQQFISQNLPEEILNLHQKNDQYFNFNTIVYQVNIYDIQYINSRLNFWNNSILQFKNFSLTKEFGQKTHFILDLKLGQFYECTKTNYQERDGTLLFQIDKQYISESVMQLSEFFALGSYTLTILLGEQNNQKDQNIIQIIKEIDGVNILKQTQNKIKFEFNLPENQCQINTSLILMDNLVEAIKNLSDLYNQQEQLEIVQLLSLVFKFNFQNSTEIKEQLSKHLSNQIRTNYPQLFEKQEDKLIQHFKQNKNQYLLDRKMVLLFDSLNETYDFQKKDNELQNYKQISQNLIINAMICYDLNKNGVFWEILHQLSQLLYYIKDSADVSGKIQFQLLFKDEFIQLINSSQKHKQLHKNILCLCLDKLDTKNYPFLKKEIYDKIPIEFIDIQKYMYLSLQKKSYSNFIYSLIELKYNEQQKQMIKKQCGELMRPSSTNICVKCNEENKYTIGCKICKKNNFCYPCAHVIKCTCGFVLALSEQVEIFDTCNYCKQGFNQELFVFKCIQKGCSIKQCIDCVYKQIEICQSYDIINFPQICGSCDQNTTLQFNHRYWHCDKCKQGGSLQNLSHRACDFDICLSCYKRYNPHKPNLIREIKEQIQCLNKIRKIDFKTRIYYYPQQFAQKLKKMIMTNFLHSLDLANQFNLEELLDFMLEMLDINDYITADTINPIITLINQNYEFVYNLVITKLFNILQKKETKESIIKLIGSNQFYDIYDKIDLNANINSEDKQIYNSLLLYKQITFLLSIIGIKTIRDEKNYIITKYKVFSETALKTYKDNEDLLIKFYPYLVEFSIDVQSKIVEINSQEQQKKQIKVKISESQLFLILNDFEILSLLEKSINKIQLKLFSYKSSKCYKVLNKQKQILTYHYFDQINLIQQQNSKINDHIAIYTLYYFLKLAYLDNFNNLTKFNEEDDDFKETVEFYDNYKFNKQQYSQFVGKDQKLHLTPKLLQHFDLVYIYLNEKCLTNYGQFLKEWSKSLTKNVFLKAKIDYQQFLDKVFQSEQQEFKYEELIQEIMHDKFGQNSLQYIKIIIKYFEYTSTTGIKMKQKSKHILIPGQNQDNNKIMVSEKISLIIQLINILHYIVYQSIETVRNNIDTNDINKIFKCVVSLKDGLKLQKKCFSFLCKNLINKDNLNYEIITDIQNLLPKINGYAQNFSDIYEIMDQNNLLQPLQKITPSSNLIYRINKAQGVQQLVIQKVEYNQASNTINLKVKNVSSAIYLKIKQHFTELSGINKDVQPKNFNIIECTDSFQIQKITDHIFNYTEAKIHLNKQNLFQQGQRNWLLIEPFQKIKITLNQKSLLNLMKNCQFYKDTILNGLIILNSIYYINIPLYKQISTNQGNIQQYLELLGYKIQKCDMYNYLQPIIFLLIKQIESEYFLENNAGKQNVFIDFVRANLEFRYKKCFYNSSSQKFKEQISHYLCFYKNYPKEISKVFQTLSHEIEHYNLNQNFDQADMTYEQEESQYKHYISKFSKYLTTYQQMNSQDGIQIPEKANKIMQFLLNLLFEQISQYKNNGYNSLNIQFNLLEPMVLAQILVRLFTIYPHLIPFSINFKNQNYDFDLLQIIFDGRYQEILNGQSLLQSIVENYPLYEIQYTKSLDHWIITSNDSFIFEKGINEFKTSLQNYVDKFIIRRNDHKEQDLEQTKQFKIIFYQISLLSKYDSIFLQILEIQLEYFHLLETKEQHDQYNLFLQNINSDQDLNIIEQVNKTKHQLNNNIFKKLEERDSDKIDLQPYFYYYNFTNFRQILHEKTIKIKEDQENDPYNFITIKSDKYDDKPRNYQTSSQEQNVQMQKILDEIQSIDFTQQILGQDEAKQMKLNKFIVSKKKGQLKVINVKSVSAGINTNLQERMFNSQNKFLNWIVNQKRAKSISELFLNFTFLEDQIRFNKVQKTIEQIKKNTDISENVNLLKDEEDEEESKQYQEKEKDLKEEILKLQIQREFNESEQLKWQLYHQREKQIIQNMKNENGEIPFDQDWRKPSINLSLQEKKKYKQFIKKLNQEEREDLLKRMDEQVVKIIDQNLYKEALALKKGVFPEFGSKNNNKSKQKSRAPKDYDYFYDELIGEQTEEEEDEEAREVRYEIEEIIQEGCDSYEIEDRISYYNELMGFNGELGQEEDKNEDQKDLLFEDFEYNEKPDFYFNNAEITKQFQQLKEKSIETLLKCFISFNSTNQIINMESICSNIQNCYQIYDTIFYLLQLEIQDIIQLSKSQDGVKILKNLGFYEIQEQLQKLEKNETKTNKIIQSLLETIKFKIICRTDLFNVGQSESNNYGYYMLFYSLISKENQTLLADCNFQEFNQNLKINSVPIIEKARNLTSKVQLNSAQQQENKIYLLPIHLLSQVYENTTQISFKEKIKEKMRNIESQIVISKVKETEQKRKNSKEILQEIQNNWEEKTLQEILQQSALNLCPSSTPILFKKINYYKSFQSSLISSEKYVFNKGIEQEFQKQIFQAFPSLYQHYDFYDQSFTETWEYVLEYYEAFLKYAESSFDNFDSFQKLLSNLNKIIEKKENICILSKQELDIFHTLNPQFQEKIMNSKDFVDLKTKFNPLFDHNNSSINLFKIQEQLEKHINQVLKLDDLKNQKKEEIKKSRMFKKYEKEIKYKDIDKQYESSQKMTKVKVKQFLMEKFLNKFSNILKIYERFANLMRQIGNIIDSHVSKQKLLDHICDIFNDLTNILNLGHTFQNVVQNILILESEKPNDNEQNYQQQFYNSIKNIIKIFIPKQPGQFLYHYIKNCQKQNKFLYFFIEQNLCDPKLLSFVSKCNIKADGGDGVCMDYNYEKHLAQYSFKQVISQEQLSFYEQLMSAYFYKNIPKQIMAKKIILLSHQNQNIFQKYGNEIDEQIYNYYIGIFEQKQHIFDVKKYNKNHNKLNKKYQYYKYFISKDAQPTQENVNKLRIFGRFIGYTIYINQFINFEFSDLNIKLLLKKKINIQDIEYQYPIIKNWNLENIINDRFVDNQEKKDKINLLEQIFKFLNQNIDLYSLINDHQKLVASIKQAIFNIFIKQTLPLFDSIRKGILDILNEKVYYSLNIKEFKVLLLSSKFVASSLPNFDQQNSSNPPIHMKAIEVFVKAIQNPKNIKKCLVPLQLYYPKLMSGLFQENFRNDIFSKLQFSYEFDEMLQGIQIDQENQTIRLGLGFQNSKELNGVKDISSLAQSIPLQNELANIYTNSILQHLNQLELDILNFEDMNQLPAIYNIDY